MSSNPTPVPRTRKRVLVLTTYVRGAGQFEPIEFRLPDSALRVTGIQVEAAAVPGQLYGRRDAFVVFAPHPGPANGDAVWSAPVNAPAGKPQAVNLTVGDVLYTAGVDYDLLAPGPESFDPKLHVGFYLSVTDEVPLQAIRVPGGMQVYYAHTRRLGLPRLVDEDGTSLTLTVETGHQLVNTRFTQYQGTTIQDAGIGGLPKSGASAKGNPSATAVPIPDTLAYLCRVEFPQPFNNGFGAALSGYWNKIFFPGVASRY